jgi:hypothetical protein
VAEGHLIEPLHQPLHLLKPGRSILAAPGGTADGNYAFFVEHIVLSKISADILKKGAEVSGLSQRRLGSRHLVYMRGRRCGLEGIVVKK